MKKLIIILGAIFLIIILVFTFIFLDYISTVSKKNVSTKEFDEFKVETLKDSEITNIEIFFSRPRLNIRIYSSNELNKNKINKILERVKPIINKENMDKIAKKYWTKNSTLSGVNIDFNLEKDKNNEMYTPYLEIDITEKEYNKEWYVER